MSCDRIQKITEALYRVTELYSDREPLKWQLRTTGLELFDFLTSNEEKEIFGKTRALDLIQRLEKFLQLAYASSVFVSNINFEVLRGEYVLLADSIQSQIENGKQELFTLKSIKNLLPLSTPDSNGQNNDSNGQSFIDNGHNGQPILLTPLEACIKDTADARGVLPLTGLKERKRKILGLIKENEWISIREISASLPEFGVKSVQRDVLEMVGDGILKKAGDKRWRKYSLV